MWDGGEGWRRRRIEELKEGEGRWKRGTEEEQEEWSMRSRTEEDRGRAKEEEEKYRGGNG